MLKITLLCNAGLAMEYGGKMLLIDLPNMKFGQFYQLPEETRMKILNQSPPYDKVCGIYFTHTHPDHCDLEFVKAIRENNPNLPVFLPQEQPEQGRVNMGVFEIGYIQTPHAPIPQAPPLVLTLVRVGEYLVYIASDAALDCEKHRAFLNGRHVDIAFWNSMYLSKEGTRILLQETSLRNYIYHMPADHQDPTGLWRKCYANFKRNGDQLTGVKVLGEYPYKIELP